jgi:hypothetical protein
MGLRKRAWAVSASRFRLPAEVAPIDAVNEVPAEGLPPGWRSAMKLARLRPYQATLATARDAFHERRLG